MDKETGGPAFPENLAVTPMGDTYSGEAGMTLRDYFAGKIAQGICAHVDTWGLMAPGIAAHAYEVADAMIAERAK